MPTGLFIIKNQEKKNSCHLLTSVLFCFEYRFFFLGKFPRNFFENDTFFFCTMLFPFIRIYSGRNWIESKRIGKNSFEIPARIILYGYSHQMWLNFSSSPSLLSSTISWFVVRIFRHIIYIYSITINQQINGGDISQLLVATWLTFTAIISVKKNLQIFFSLAWLSLIQINVFLFVSDL